MPLLLLLLTLSLSVYGFTCVSEQPIRLFIAHSVSHTRKILAKFCMFQLNAEIAEVHQCCRTKFLEKTENGLSTGRLFVFNEKNVWNLSKTNFQLPDRHCIRKYPENILCVCRLIFRFNMNPFVIPCFAFRFGVCNYTIQLYTLWHIRTVCRL